MEGTLRRVRVVQYLEPKRTALQALASIRKRAGRVFRIRVPYRVATEGEYSQEGAHL